MNKIINFIQKMNINIIDQLLDDISRISQDYEEKARKTGENFNVFSIMNMEWDEVKTHSAIIGELLNPKGTHAQGSVFQKLFIDIINEEFNSDGINLDYFGDLLNENICERTISVSNNWEKITGGRIDIILEDKNQIIIIENKPGYQDQPLQLIRYSNYAKTRRKPFKIFYLTLDGRNIQEDEDHTLDELSVKGRNIHFSKKHEYKELHNECVYYPISFKKNIKEWIDKCLEKTRGIPIIYQTLFQYLNTIKAITNQPINDKMSTEIVDIILKDEDNFENYKVLFDSYNSVIKEVINNTVISVLHSIAEEFELELFVDDNFENGNIFTGFHFNNEKMNEKNVRIRFNFESADFKSPIIGLQFINNEDIELQDFTQIEEEFSRISGSDVKTSENYAYYFSYAKYSDWKNLDVLKKLKFGNFEIDLRFIISQILEIFK